jgi:hypothetical protein
VEAIEHNFPEEAERRARNHVVGASDDRNAGPARQVHSAMGEVMRNRAFSEEQASATSGKAIAGSYIDGAWIQTDHELVVIDPATAQPFAKVCQSVRWGEAERSGSRAWQ